MEAATWARALGGTSMEFGWTMVDWQLNLEVFAERDSNLGIDEKAYAEEPPHFIRDQASRQFQLTSPEVFLHGANAMKSV